MSETSTGDLDPDRIPHHIGIILDGNGRWANARGLPRTAGHAAGESALFDVVDEARLLGVGWLTAFVFSTENWGRSQEEVEFLMWFNEDLLLRRRDELHEDGVRVIFMGDMADPRIPDRNRVHMAETETLTADNQAMTLVFAFNYGSRREIAEAARRLAESAVAGELNAASVDEASLAGRMYLPEMPDVDLVIRTSGEHRISNFLLWQAAYAELFFPEVLWPDFGRMELRAAIAEYQRRDRRFGGAIDLPVVT
ncbi:MAG TPA: polyprenyl diphosphate synthase [Acidimicrobiia bacterium]|jgi:undecaprenyl diphosphate synthase